MINSIAYYNDFWNEMRGMKLFQTVSAMFGKAKQMPALCRKNLRKNIWQR